MAGVVEKRATLAGKATRKIGYENVKACQLEVIALSTPPRGTVSRVMDGSCR